MVGFAQVMMGASAGPLANLANHTVQGWEQSEANPTPPPAVTYIPAVATYYIDAAGTARGIGTSGDGGAGTFATYAGEWLVSGNAGNCEVRATLSSGTVNAGSDATGSWLVCSTNRSWTINWAIAGSKTTVLIIEIRNKNTLAILATATITLTCSR